jgi:hypothetical protein
VEASGLAFEVWRDGAKVAAKKFASSNGKLWQEYRFDGNAANFYQYSHDGKTCYIKPSVTGESFATDSNIRHQPGIYSINNLANIERLLDDPKSTINSVGNGVLIANQGLFQLTVDPASHLVSSMTRPDLNGFVMHKFDYPEKIDPSIFQPPTLSGAKVFRYEDDKAAIEKSLRDTLGSKPIGDGKVVLLGCFHVAGTNAISVVWDEFEKDSRIEKAPIVENLSSGERVEVENFRPERKEFTHIFTDSKSGKHLDDSPLVCEKYLVKAGTGGGFTVLVPGAIGPKVNLQVPAVHKKAYLELKDLQGKPKKFYSHKIEMVLFKDVPVVEVFNLDPLYELCKPAPIQK